MAGNADNIIIGAATVLLNGVDVGFTKGGVSIRFEREYCDIGADQAGGVIRKAKESEKMFVKTSFLEITLERLRIAWDQPSANYQTIASKPYLYFGQNDSCSINTHVIELIGTGLNCATRTFRIYKAIAISEAEYLMTRDEETALEVEFECLKDSNNSNRFGFVFDS
jgi:hypothetical protein